MFVKNVDVKPKDLGQGVSRKIVAAGGKIMAVEVYFAKGAIGALHSHPHEQVSYVVNGSFEATIGAETTIIRTGDSYYVPPDLIHGVAALEDGLLLDVFTPQREDFLR
jgi:quercetin dioxygenase-like cupin family protein